MFARYCFSCHGSEVEAPPGGLVLESREGLLAGGLSGPAVVPGQPGRSRLLLALRGEPLLMPPTGALRDETIEDVTEWIRMGAPWPAAPTPAESGEGFDLEARRKAHWAWHPLENVAPPAVEDHDWLSNPVDSFILARLEAEGLRPAGRADSLTLLRRLSLDLTGLPPRAGEVARLAGEEGPGAYLRTVRRLLESQHFGEHWARHWMDLVRYADSHGSEGDPAVPHAWEYRDYLVRALNADVPYDQLVREHVAGDLLERPRMGSEGQISESLLGTAHLRLGELGYQPVDPWEERVKWADNQIDVLSKAFLGLTVSCARCHDHKFDAISQEDYYALFGTLYGARPTLRTIESPSLLATHSETLRGLKDRIRQALAAAWVASAEDLGRRLADMDEDTVRDALEAAACDEASPLHAWLELNGLEEGQLADAWSTLRASWRREIAAREAFNGSHFERIWNLGSREARDWIGHGTGVSALPSGPGTFRVALSGADVLEGIYPGGVYTHLLSTKHPGVVQSPRFEIGTDYISVKVLGEGLSFARLIIENYSLPLSGIYHQRYSPRHDTHRWWQWKTDFWKGFTGYIEFATRDDATNFHLDPIDARKTPRPERPTDGRSAIGASAVAFHNGDHEPRATVEPILFLLQADAPKSVGDLAGLLGERLADAARAWGNGSQNEMQAAYLDHFVRQRLLPRSVAGLDGIDDLVAEYRRLESDVPVPRRFPSVLEEAAPDQPLLVRGDPRQPGPPVARRFLAALGGAEFDSPATVRLDLANQLASPANPLAARVFVNRIWQHLFGRGLVATPDNFGALGAQPSHPRLLDYLARRFMREGWSVKRLVELLVTSSTYQMGSDPSAGAVEKDSLNELLQHMPVRRLAAEAIRDSVLAVSGELDPRMYGAHPVSRSVYGSGNQPQVSPYGDRRRSIYQEVRRNRTNPFLEVFDQPTPLTTRGRRDVTNVPAQSLAMMNSPFVTEAASAWGARLADGEGHSVSSRLRYMYLRALGRPPSESELADAEGFVQVLAEEEGAQPEAVLGHAGVWGRFAHALFNFKEFLFVR